MLLVVDLLVAGMAAYAALVAIDHLPLLLGVGVAVALVLSSRLLLGALHRQVLDGQSSATGGRSTCSGRGSRQTRSVAVALGDRAPPSVTARIQQPVG